MKIIVGIVVMLLLGCAGPEKVERPQPDWVSGKSSEYSISRFLIGKGQAARRDVATDRARADLAKNIEVQVLAESRDTVSASRQTVNGEVSDTQFNESVARNIRTRTQMVVRGAQVSDLWQAPGGDFHVMVTLNRSQASRNLRDEIFSLDDRARVAVARARQSEDSLLKIAALQRALDWQIQRTELHRVLRVVGGGRENVRTTLKLAELQDALLTAQRALKIRAQADDAGLAAQVEGGIAAAGFVAANEAEASFTLQATWIASPVLQQDGWYWLRGTLELTLLERGGNVRGAVSWPLKVSAREEAQLVPRLSQRIEQTLKDKLRAEILGFAE